jgi:predicted phosphatase
VLLPVEKSAYFDKIVAVNQCFKNIGIVATILITMKKGATIDLLKPKILLLFDDKRVNVNNSKPKTIPTKYHSITALKISFQK